MQPILAMIWLGRWLMEPRHHADWASGFSIHVLCWYKICVPQHLYSLPVECSVVQGVPHAQFSTSGAISFTHPAHSSRWMVDTLDMHGSHPLALYCNQARPDEEEVGPRALFLSSKCRLHYSSQRWWWEMRNENGYQGEWDLVVAWSACISFPFRNDLAPATCALCISEQPLGGMHRGMDSHGVWTSTFFFVSLFRSPSSFLTATAYSAHGINK